MQVPLPDGWGEAALFEADETPWADATRSYDHGGASMAWRPPGGVPAACDIEREDTPVEAMAMRFGLGAQEFLCQWVQAEVAAKIENEPIVLRLRRTGLGPPPTIRVLQFNWGGRVMAFGFGEQVGT